MTLQDAVDTAVQKLTASASGWDKQAATLLIRAFPGFVSEDSTTDQLRRSVALIEVAGMYDAADAIKRALHLE